MFQSDTKKMRWYRAPSNVQAEIQRPFLRYLFVALALRL